MILLSNTGMISHHSLSVISISCIVSFILLYSLSNQYKLNSERLTQFLFLILHL